MDYEKYMHRCLHLAKLGVPNAFPNPLVGSVIVHNNKIIGEGYHKTYGKSHAEVNAINAVQNQELLKSSTLFVNLEPCNHYGKTPPCTKLIIEKGIPEVVIGCIDSCEKVCGSGIKTLKEAGVKVKLEVLEKESLEINKRFFTFQKHKRPYIILKWAQTSDGFIDIDRSKEKYDREKHWITGKAAQQLVHQWRAEETAILVGGKTANNDNPQLNTRLIEGKNPLRIILSENEILKEELKIFKDKIPTIIYSRTNYNYVHIENVMLPEQDVLDFVLNDLYKRKTTSLIVEGGRKILDSFIQQKLWDEARIFTGNKEFQTGIKAPNINGETVSSYSIEYDKYQQLINK